MASHDSIVFDNNPRSSIPKAGTSQWYLLSAARVGSDDEALSRGVDFGLGIDDVVPCRSERDPVNGLIGFPDFPDFGVVNLCRTRDCREGPLVGREKMRRSTTVVFGALTPEKRSAFPHRDRRGTPRSLETRR